MAVTLSDIQRAFETKSGLNLPKEYRGSTNVGFVGDSATVGGQSFSSPLDLYNALSGAGIAGGPRSSVSGGGVGGFSDVLKQAQEMISGQLKPITEKIESTIPLIGKAYESRKGELTAQKQSLADRYKSLLDQITGRQERAITEQTRVTGAELAKRGLTPESTLTQQELRSAVAPIEQQYGELATQTGLAQAEETGALERSIAGLPLEQQLAEAQVMKDVANILAGGVSQGAGLAQSLYPSLVAQEQYQQQLPQQQLLQQIQTQLAQQQLSQAQQQQPLLMQQLQAQIDKMKQSSVTPSVSLESLWGIE